MDGVVVVVDDTWAVGRGLAPAELLVAGVDYPRDERDVRMWFATDAACRDYLEWLRWPEGFVCPVCGHRGASGPRGGLFRCLGCRRRVSVTAGTVLDGTRVPLTVWFEAVWQVVAGKEAVSAAHLQRVLPIGSYQTTWAMLARLRSVMGWQDSAPLSGRVEVDETYLGGPHPGKGGRGAAGKVLVAGAIETGPAGGRAWGRARLAVIADASKKSLGPFITTTIAPGSTVVTDAWPTYPPLLAGTWVHEPHSIRASGRPAHQELPAVHRLFALVDHFLKAAYHGSFTPEHLDAYLDEFVFRFNRRHARHRGLLMLRVLQRVVNAPPVRYQDLALGARKGSTNRTGRPGPHTRPDTLEGTITTYPWRNQPPPAHWH